MPSDLALSDDPASALLLIHRAQLRARNDDAPGATADLDRATELAGDTPWLLLSAGDGWLALDRPERARQVWTRAPQVSPASADGGRAEALRRLARLDEREGRSGTALRLWHEVLALVPGDAEAERRAGVEEPRRILKAFPQSTFLELPHNRYDSQCCGAGGGYKIQFNDRAENIASRRVEEARSIGAGMLVSSCPFCVTNLTGGVKVSGAKMEVAELVSLVADSVQR